MWELSPKKGWMSEWAESPFPRVKGLNEVYVCLQLKFSAEGSLDWIGVITLLNCQASCFCYMMHQSVQDPSWRLWHFQGIEKTQIRKFYNGKEDWNYSRWFFYQVHTLTTSHGNSAPLRHSSFIENYEVPTVWPGMVMDTAMVLWIWHSHCHQKTPISETLGKDKTWATSAQNQDLQNRNCSRRATGLDMGLWRYRKEIIATEPGHRKGWERCYCLPQYNPDNPESRDLRNLLNLHMM